MDRTEPGLRCGASETPFDSISSDLKPVFLLYYPSPHFLRGNSRSVHLSLAAFSPSHHPPLLIWCWLCSALCYSLNCLNTFESRLNFCLYPHHSIHIGSFVCSCSWRRRISPPTSRSCLETFSLIEALIIFHSVSWPLSALQLSFLLSFSMLCPLFTPLHGLPSFINPPFAAHLLEDTCISPSFVLSHLLSSFFHYVSAVSAFSLLRSVDSLFLPPNHYSRRAFASLPPRTFFSRCAC